MITLFGNLESGNDHKVQLILSYVNMPFIRVDVSQARGEPSLPEFLKINPIGKIPTVLLDDGDVLSESNAILFYFGENTPLWPAERRARTEVLRWLFFEQYSHEPTLSVIRYLKNFTDNPDHYQQQIRSLIPKARRALEVLEMQLAKNTWIASDTCTIADYALYPYTRLGNEAGFELEEFNNIQNWLARFENQPGFIPPGTEGAQRVFTYSEYFRGSV